MGGFWDPLGLAKDGDAATFARRRATEIKHGRVSMYACIGYIVPEYFRWPGELSPSEGIKFTDVPNGLGAFSKVPALGWFQILAFCGALEITGWTFSKGQNIGFGKDASVNGEPGNYGLGPLGAFNLIKKDPAARQEAQCRARQWSTCDDLHHRAPLPERRHGHHRPRDVRLRRKLGGDLAQGPLPIPGGVRHHGGDLPPRARREVRQAFQVHARQALDAPRGRGLEGP